MEVLDFAKKSDLTMGDPRWWTVVSPDGPDGTEWLLEPAEHPAVEPFQEALPADGIPFTTAVFDDFRIEQGNFP